MLDDEWRSGVGIITVQARLGKTYAVWLPDRRLIVVAADTAEEQMDAILKLVERLLDVSAGRDRTPTRTRTTGTRTTD